MNNLSIFTGGKLGNGRGTRVGAAVSAVGLAAILAGCAAAPGGPVSERLDPDTATTVIILSRPIELLSQGYPNSHGGINDPFAYIAPFETDRMGERDLYLWVSTPQQAQGAPQQPQVLCNGQTLGLQPLSQAPKVDLSQLNLSREPYEAPVPWSTQWYFRLPAEGLKCLAENGITVEAPNPNGAPVEFIASGRKNLASLDAFTRR